MTRGESPAHLQTSTAGAITLGFEKGTFYRDARLYCVNLLLTYGDGCSASCAFCGLGRDRAVQGSNQDKSFIRVRWPVFETARIVDALGSSRCEHVRRVCISMVTRRKARDDAIEVARALAPAGKAISVLLAPTIVDEAWLRRLKDETTVDKVGIAIDAATPALFGALRAEGVGGPHSWVRYHEVLRAAITVFGGENTGVHAIVGLGETEREMITFIQDVVDAGSTVHLFSFFPEPGSAMDGNPQPGIGKYRRVQLARQLVVDGLAKAVDMSFNDRGQVIDFGVDAAVLDATIDAGIAFMTQGCTDDKGFISCNRPYANCTPFQAAKGELRNYPFPPAPGDLDLVRRQLGRYDDDAWVRPLDVEPDFLLDEP